MPPITLTEQQFHAQRPKGKYAAYKRYIARHRPQMVQQRKQRQAANRARLTDPLRPYNEQEIRTRARQDVMPGVNAQVDQITQSINRRAQAGMGAIGGYTNDLVQSLGRFPGQVAGIYGGALSSQANVDNALREALAGGGGQQAAELGAKLAAINAPARQVDDVAGGAQRIGQGSAGAAYALGSAELGRLIGESAGEQTYAAKRPGIAGLAGLQDARQLQMALSGQLADQVGDIRSQVPGLLQQAVGGYRDQEMAKYNARAGREENVYNRQRQTQQDKRQRMLDQIAQQAAAQEFGLDVGKYQSDVSDDRADNARADAEARRKTRESALKEKTARDEKRRETFDNAREGAFSRARELAAQTRKDFKGDDRPNPVPKKKARARLMAEYGSALLEQGYSKAEVNRMILRALDAAGY